jgi:nucleotide-binding universal stress UspA family protein
LLLNLLFETQEAIMLTTNPQRILVPTDFSEIASKAMRYASDLARRIGASLTIVYADPFVSPIDYTATVGGWDESSFDRLKGRAEEQLQRDAEANIDRSVLYDAIVRVAPPLDGILEQARESGSTLIVMGTHGRTGFRRLFLGSVTEAVIRKAEIPVIAVPPGGDWKPAMSTILCPAVYNAQCRDALRFAASIAPIDAKFIVIRSTPENDCIDTLDSLLALRAWLPESIAPRCDLKIFGSGHLAGQVEGYAQKVEADLIVVAERTERSAADVLHGTFAARLIQYSDCPVLTMNQPAAKRVAQPAGHECALELMSR